MELLPAIKANKCSLTDRKMVSAYRFLSKSKPLSHNDSVPCSKHQNSASESKLKKINSNLFILPLPSKFTPSTSKVNFAISNYNLLKSRLLKHRNSEQLIHNEKNLKEGSSTGRLSEAKFNFQVDGKTIGQEKQSFKVTMHKLKLQEIQKKFKNIGNGHTHFDNTVPKSLSIQSKL